VPELNELRHQIDDLALNLVVGGMDGGEGWPPSCISSLEQIRDSAKRENAERVAAAAVAILEAIREADSRPESAAGSAAADVQKGIVRLQEAVEREAQAGSAQAPDTAASAGGSPPVSQSLAQDAELLSDFILESREHLTAIEAQVLTLERDPCNSEALNSVFRGYHTIKGLAGFLELWDIQKFSHEVEAILDRARNFQLKLSSTAIDVILQSADYLQRWLAHLETLLHNQPSAPPEWNAALFARIQGISELPSGTEPAADQLSSLASAISGGGPDSAAVPPQDAPPAVEEAAAEPAENAPAGRRSETLAVKVDTAKLDYLVDMAGEMVIAESLVRHDPELHGTKSPRLQRNLAQLTRITSELQKTAMAMRMVPIGPLFRRMARLVRDLSRQFGKQVRMETEGDEIELDRTIVESLSDPLMHMVRNALDHGIESPEERLAAGKSASARVLLKAHHQAGHVVIEIADDGRGLDRGKIEAKAIQKGLIASTEGLADSEVYNLIFEPGFSTAAQVTNVSGRGVGMDVVRRHVEKLRGRIEIRSTAQKGSSFLLKLPLTLAIIDGLVVGVGAERYIVPLFAVREMFRPTADTIWTVQQRSEMALVRDSLLPVIRLYRRFRVEPKSEDPRQAVLIVAESESRRFCLLVDELIGKQEVVIKSLGETFKNVPGIAGGAILGDGRVGLILELDRLFKDRTCDASS
jgi:two-component system chemotaxis sensor kinase CheA